jgi:OOP family OmpA-OmpF porin
MTRAEKGWLGYNVEGLRDPLAADPAALLAAAGIDPQKVVSRWEPYQALAPSFILARARALLEPPPSVTLELRDGTLSAAGSAARQWIAEARRLARAIPGVTQFNTEALLPDELVALRKLKAEFEGQTLRFVLNKAQFAPGQPIERLAAAARELERAAAEAGQQLRIQVVGHTDERGSDASNQLLSEERAARVRRLLVASGVNPATLEAIGVGAREPLRAGTSKEDLQLNRSVTFGVGLSEASARKAAQP